MARTKQVYDVQFVIGKDTNELVKGTGMSGHVNGIMV